MFDIPPAPVVPVTTQCIESAAARFALPSRLLYSILQVEGGRPGYMAKNSNGTYDLGPMQINTIWLNTFSDYVTPSQILYNGCVNILVGAWILRSKINQASSFWQGVGDYHSKTPKLNSRYQQKVYKVSQRLG